MGVLGWGMGSERTFSGQSPADAGMGRVMDKSFLLHGTVMVVTYALRVCNPNPTEDDP